MVGLLPLEQGILVRIQVSEPTKITPIKRDFCVVAYVALPILGA